MGPATHQQLEAAGNAEINEKPTTAPVRLSGCGFPGLYSDLQFSKMIS